MKTKNGIIILENAVGLNPSTDGVTYTDESNTSIHIPMELIVHLYEIAKYNVERQNVNWEEFCDSLFEKKA